MSDVSELLGELNAFCREWRSKIDDKLRTEHDLPLRMYEVMRAISEGAPDVVTVAERLDGDVITTSLMIGRLVSRGLCLVDEESRQSAILGLTLGGAFLFKHASVVYEDEIHRLTQTALSSEATDALLTVMSRSHPRRPPALETTSTTIRTGE